MNIEGKCFICDTVACVRPADQQIIYKGTLVNAFVCHACYLKYVVPYTQWGVDMKEAVRASNVPPERFEITLSDTDDIDLLKANPLAHTESNYTPPAQADRVDWILRMTRGYERILDCGCNQWMSEAMGAQAGLDIDAYALKVHKACYPARDLYWGSIQEMPFKNNEFDCVVMGEVLEHQGLEGAERAVKEGIRVGNYVVATVPNFDDFAQMYWNPDYHLWEVKETELRSMLESLDLEFTLHKSKEGQFFLFKVWGEVL